MNKLTLIELKEGSKYRDYIPYSIACFIWSFANIYTKFDLFEEALNYVIAVVSNDKTDMPWISVE